MKRHRRANCFATKTINNQGVAAEKPLFSEGQSRKSRQLHVRFESQRLLQCARHGSAWRNLSGRITTRERRDTATKRYPSFRQVRFNGACGSTKRQVAARREQKRARWPLFRCKGWFTNIAQTASGTLSSLCRVLFHPSLMLLVRYRFHTGIRSLVRTTSHVFELHSQGALLANGTSWECADWNQQNRNGL